MQTTFEARRIVHDDEASVNESTATDVPLTEEQLTNLVDRFYAKVRKDGVLGPVFNQAVEDWPVHLDRLSAFWSSVMLTSGRYKGNPMAVHLKHREAIRPAMFSRWLELWRETARETLSKRGADGVIEKADRIAESLQLGLFLELDGLKAGVR